MDQRLDERYPATFEVSVTNLENHSQTCRGIVSDISKSGLAMTSPLRFTPGSVVKLDFADSELFGYVVYSEPRDSSFRTGVEVERVLLGGTDLSQLLRGVLQQEMPHVVRVGG